MTKHRYHHIAPLKGCASARWLLSVCIASAVFLVIVQFFGPLTRSSFRADALRIEYGDNIVRMNNDVHIGYNITEAVQPPKQESVEVVNVDRNTAKKPSERWIFNFNVMMKPRECGQSSCNFSETVVICVSSAASYLERRLAIRQTWGSEPSIRVLFFLGKSSSYQSKLNEEAELHNDIVQYDFEDTYKNLTLKSVAMLRFVSKYQWSNLIYFIKADDDTFVNTKNLPETLKAIADEQNRGLYGALQVGSRPIRSSKNKWFVSFKEFPEKVYPNYLAGCFYIIHVNLLQLLNSKATSVTFLYLEDAYITGTLARSLRIPRFQIPKHIVDSGLNNTKVELIALKYVAKHYMTPERMFQTFAVMEKIPKRQLTIE